jgi:hypothetical protein
MVSPQQMLQIKVVDLNLIYSLLGTIFVQQPFSARKNDKGEPIFM